MRYTEFHIENYKGIKELTLKLDKDQRIITLVGLNESGKTSILEAINFLHQETPKSDRYKLIPKNLKLSFTGHIKVKCKLSLSDSDNLIISTYAKSIGLKAVKPAHELHITKQSIFANSIFKEEKILWTYDLSVKKQGTNYLRVKPGSEEWSKIVLYIRDHLIPKILYYPDFLFDFPSKIYLEKDFSIQSKQLQFRDVIQDILTSISKDLTIEDHIITRLQNKTSESTEALDHTLSKMSAQISKIVLGAWKDIMNIKGKEFFVEAKSEIVNVSTKNDLGAAIITKREVYYLDFRLKEGTEKYFISERSLGFKWFFTFLLFTEFRKNRKTDLGQTIFLLDEPASNLHSTAQKKLLSRFEDLISKGTLIYTTHSHHLINPKHLNGAYIVKNEALDYQDSFEFNPQSTNIGVIPYKRFVAENPTQRDYFQPILDALEYQPGMLEYVPDIIITEGKSDFYIYKYVSEIILDNSFSNLRFHPGNGADSSYTTIRLYAAWGRGFTILLDGDQGGQKAKANYIKEFGTFVASHIVSLKEIKSEFTYAIEGLFSEDEKLVITKEFDPAATDYSKSKFSSGIQLLFVNGRKINLSTATIENFKTIFSWLSNFENRE